MKITLITPTPPDISAFGVRALSAYLKSHRIPVQIIFLPGGIEKLKHGGGFTYAYTPAILYQIIERVGDSTIVGLSFMSQYRDRAIQLTQAIRSQTPAMIVWGGIHAEADPVESLQVADAVCMGEGEHVLLELLDRLESGDPIDEIPGLRTRHGDPDQSQEVVPCIDDLDQLPFIDMGPEDHWILNPITEELQPVTSEILNQVLPLMPAPIHHPSSSKAITVYRTMTSRGCPHRCTYCANSVKADRHTGIRYLRFRNPDHVLRELKQITERFPFIQGIHFFDDVFTAMPWADLEVLCHRYQTEIGLPWYAQASPATLTRDLLEMFLETGLAFIEMGIQTGSPRIREMYRRPETNQQILDAARLIHDYRSRLITPHYHVILDNPWETREDVRQTLGLLTRIPGRFMLCLASLTFYPGTQLNQKAHEEGLIQDEESDVYRKPFYIPKGRYLNYLIYLTDIPWIPRSLLRWLGGVPAELLDHPVFHSLFDLLRRITDQARLASKGLSALFHGEFSRIFKYLRRVQ